MATYDQQAARVTATGAVTDRRSRVHSIHWVGVAGAGQVTLTDGNGGSTKLVFDTPAGASNSGQIYIGEESGLLFQSSVYCSAITAGVLLTVFYT